MIRPMTPIPAAATTLAPDALLHQLRWRYATKRFDPTKKIDPDTWRALEEALILSPSSFGLQPWRFYVVTDPEVRERLKPAAWNQAQITDASHLIVFTIKKGLARTDVERYVARIAAVRNVTRDSLAGFAQVMIQHVERPKSQFDIDEWSRRQVYLALGNFLCSAAILATSFMSMRWSSRRTV